MTDRDVIKLLATACENAGSLREWARQNNVSATYVSGVMRRTIRPGTKILAGLGLERRVTIEKVRRA